MSETQQKQEEQLPENTKKLTPEHALVLENIALKIDLLSQQISSAQKDIEMLKSTFGNIVNKVKGSYFENAGDVAVDVVKGLIILQPPKETSKAESDQ